MNISSLKPSERLDIVLKYMLTIQTPHFRTFDEICTDLRNLNYQFKNDEIFRIINKLKKDEFIHEEIHTIQMVQHYRYYLSFEGEAILELEDGYTGRLSSQQRNIALERRNEKYLRHGAVWAALFAGGLLIWDVIKFLVENGSIEKGQVVAYLFLLLLSILVALLVRKLP